MSKIKESGLSNGQMRKKKLSNHPLGLGSCILPLQFDFIIKESKWMNIIIDGGYSIQ
jgi:hypothetical protein